MERLFLLVLLTALVGFVFTAPLSAQTGGSGTGSGSGSGGMGSGSSSSGSIGTGSQFQSSTTAPEFEGFQGVEANSSFVGVNSGVPFVGREEVFGTSSSSTRTSNVRSMTSNTRRTTTTRRSTSSRSMSSGRSGSTSGSREVRAETMTDFAFSPMEVNGREAAFRTRLGRMPNFRVIPEQVEIKVGQTPAGTVATLIGNVPTERDRRLVQQLVLLEPGIDRVENNLVIADDPAKKTDSLPKLDPGATP